MALLAPGLGLTLPGLEFLLVLLSVGVISRADAVGVVDLLDERLSRFSLEYCLKKITNVDFEKHRRKKK